LESGRGDPDIAGPRCVPSARPLSCAHCAPVERISWTRGSPRMAVRSSSSANRWRSARRRCSPKRFRAVCKEPAAIRLSTSSSTWSRRRCSDSNRRQSSCSTRLFLGLHWSSIPLDASSTPHAIGGTQIPRQFGPGPDAMIANSPAFPCTFCGSENRDPSGKRRAWSMHGFRQGG